MFLLDDLLEATETEDFSLKTIDPRETSHNAETDNALFAEAYRKAMASIGVSYDNHEKLFREVILNIKNEKIGECTGEDISAETYALIINPVINCNLFSFITKYLQKEDIAGSNSDDIVDKFKNELANSMQIEGFLGPKIKTTIPCSIIAPNINLVTTNILNLNDEMYLIYELIGQKIGSCNDPMMVESLARIFDYCTRVLSGIVAAYYQCAIKLFALTRTAPLTESSGKNEESAKKYIDEIDVLIDKVRDFYKNFKYKEIIIPRKKREHKMYEYVLGALERKYTLKIPIYKVEGVSKDVKDIVEHQFIDKLKSITNQFPNFCIMSPSWDEETDMFIYITLREPFGDKPDRKDRENQVQNEASLSTEERNKLEDYEFGLPETRDYPLNDEARIRKAIQFFGYCKSKNKQILADNIVIRIIELDLVGKVTITEKHPNKKYFPDWMLNTYKPELKRIKNKYEIYVDGKKVDYGTLKDHTPDEDGHRLIINENGNLY